MSNVMHNHIRHQLNRNRSYHPRYYGSADDNGLVIILIMAVVAIGVCIGLLATLYFSNSDTTRQTTSEVNTERHAAEFRDAYASVYGRADQLSDTALVAYLTGDNLDHDGLVTAYSVISTNRSIGLLAQPQLNRF